MKRFKLNFKSIVQRKARWLLTIIAILTLGVGQMWADSSVNGGEIYFDASQSGWGDIDVNYVVGHGTYSCWYEMTHISNTKLHYISSSSWSDATYFAFTSDYGWGNNNCEGNKYDSRKGFGPTGKKYTATCNYGVNSGSTYLFYASSASDDASITTSSPAGYLGAGKTYEDLNYTQTLNQTLSTDGGSSYSASTLSLATVTVSSYKLDDVDSSTEDEGTIEGGESSTSCDAARTATVTYSVSSVATGYDFVGWYDGSTQKSTSTSYSYTSTGTKTITARFKKKQYTVTYGVYNAENGTISLNSGSAVDDNSSSTLNHGTSISFTATPSSGYQVDGWYSTSACNTTPLQDGGNTYNAGTLTAATIVYVKFKVRTGGTITLSAEANGQVSTDNSTWGSTKTITNVTTATDKNIYARGNTGYQFSSWTKSSGSGTIKTNAASGVFTTVAYEDATVTASFSEIMSTLTTANSYDGASAGFSNPTKSVSSIGVTTTATVTAASNSLGYTLTSWTIENGERTDGGAEDANPITVCSDGSGNAVTVTANYTGSNRPVDIYLSGTMNSWTTSSSDWQFYKLPGESGNTVTLEVDVNKYDYSGSSYKWGFNIYHSDWDKKWWNNRNDYDTNMDAHNCEDWDFNVEPNSKRTYLDLNVSGKYIFTLENSTNSASQSLTVTYPDKSFVEGAFPTAWDEDAYTLTEDGDVQTVTINITSTGDKQFRLVSHGKLFGTSTKITKDANEQTLSAKNMNDGGATMTLSASVIGEYTFTYDEGDKELTVTYPSVSQLQIYSSTSAPDPAVANVNWDSHEGNVYSKTVSLKANTSYTFKAVVESDFYTNGGTVTRSTSTASNTLTSLTTSGSNMTITTDFAGDYTFAFDISAKTLVVTYPTAYQATFTKSIVGTDNSTTSAPTASYNTGATSVTSATTWIPTGTDVTFLAATEGTGYTWKGWYSKANPSPDYEEDVSFLDGDKEYTAEITSAVTIYAVYEEDMHTVTVTAGTHGSISTPASGTPRTVSAGIATAASIEATPDTKFYFGEWEQVSGSVTFTNNKSASTTVKATEDSEIKANFVSSWTVGGDFNGWNMDQYGLDNFGTRATGSKDTAYVEINFPANTTYSFKIYDRENTQWWGNENYCDASDCSANAWINYANNNGKEWQFATGRRDCGLITAGKGTYRFAWNITDHKMAVQFPTSWTVTYGKKVIYNETDGTLTDADTEGSIVSVVDGDEIALESGKYVVGGGSVTVVAEPATGYEIAGWYSDAACTTPYTNGEGNVTISGEGNTNFTISSLAANTGIYVKFSEIMTTVTFAHNSHGHVEIGGATVTSTTTGVTTTRALVAVPDDGYYLASWTLSDGADFVLEDKSDAEDVSVTLRGSGAGTASTLTANFVELDKVYFKNWDEGSSAKLMENVYVYFDITWNNETPTKAVTSSRNSDDHLYAQMTEISNNIYWAYVPRVFTKKSGDEKNIGFANVEMTENNFKFYSGNTSTIAIAATRGDYNRAINMFVPCHTPKKTNANYVDYYDDGYWKNYGLAGEKSGYKILRWDGSKYVNPASKGTGDDYQFVVIDDNTISYELRIDNTTDEHHNRFKIYTVANTSYTTAKGSPSNPGITITTANCNSLIGLKDYETNNNPIFEIMPTSDGIYTLTIDQSADTMTLKVDYPLAVGDYMLVHSYNDGTAKTTKSDVIKSGEIATRTYSMFIDNNSSHSPSLKLKKCTAISDSKPTWSAGTNVAMTGFGTSGGFTADTIGVFQFKISIDGDDNGTLSDIEVYKGEFYIKTDIAPGGWTAYKANVMEKNTITFDKSKSSTFDRSFCHWIGNTTTNIKCVIANDYGIAISDTLESDDILGGSSQYLPHAAHVRFSYNSTTNELKRTYLNITDTDSLILEGSTLSSGTIKTIHDTSGEGEGVAFDANKATLGSLSNFTYYVDVKAREQARARLSAKYNNVVQDLIGSTAGVLEGEGVENSTVEVLGGGGSTYKAIRIIYDFKTNYLMSAWLANSDPLTESKVLDADLIIIREGQGDARQITFSGDYSITEIGKVYGVMEFNKWTLNNKDKSTHETLASPLSPYERDLYWISFPFDVKLSDAFGMGTYGIHWIIERYDGKGRAKNGFWADSESNWKFVTPYQRDSGFVMNANEGYILALDLDELKDGEGESLVWDNGMTEAYLYFPSKDDVGSILKTSKTVTFANQSEYKCTINRPTPDGNRTIKDSYWHCIGVPSYAEKDTFVNINYNASDIPDVTDWSTQDLPFLYEWRSNDNSLAPRKTSEFTFKPMYSYLVQYSKDAMLWKTVNATPAAVAARMTETPNLEYELALLREDDEQDRTYVRMTDDVNVSTGFEFNYDLSKEMNRNRGNIWTVTADTVQVAGNSQPHPLTTTIVPVGVKIAANGEYTFSMPEGTNGGDVWLIDNANSSRTNLGLMDYTVNLTTGTYEGRFSLEFPVQNVVTEIENAANANANANADVRKVFVGGRLYILRDGKAYDATGAQVR